MRSGRRVPADSGGSSDGSLASERRRGEPSRSPRRQRTVKEKCEPRPGSLSDPIVPPAARPAAADRQAQAGAAVQAGGRGVGLAERPEQPVHAVRPGCRSRCRGRRSAARRLAASRGARRGRLTEPHLALRRELDALSRRLTRTAAGAPRSLTTAPGTAVADLAAEGQPLARAASRRHELDRARPDSRAGEGDAPRSPASRLDLGEVEDVVDHRQQGLAAAADRLDVVPLLAACSARAAGARWSCRGRRSSACGSRGSCWPGTRSWRGSPPRPLCALGAPFSAPGSAACAPRPARPGALAAAQAHAPAGASCPGRRGTRPRGRRQETRRLLETGGHHAGAARTGLVPDPLVVAGGDPEGVGARRQVGVVGRARPPASTQSGSNPSSR